MKAVHRNTICLENCKNVIREKNKLTHECIFTIVLTQNLLVLLTENTNLYFAPKISKKFEFKKACVCVCKGNNIF